MATAVQFTLSWFFSSFVQYDPLSNCNLWYSRYCEIWIFRNKHSDVNKPIKWKALSQWLWNVKRWQQVELNWAGRNDGEVDKVLLPFYVMHLLIYMISALPLTHITITVSAAIAAAVVTVIEESSSSSSSNETDPWSRWAYIGMLWNKWWRGWQWSVQSTDDHS